MERFESRRLTYTEVDELKKIARGLEEKIQVCEILKMAGYILDFGSGEFYYEPEKDTYLGTPTKLENGTVSPSEYLRWYKDAVSRGVLPEEMDEATANLLYTTYQPDPTNYRKPENKEFYNFWENIEKLVYGDRYMSEEEAIALNEEMKMNECYDPSGEI